MRIESTASELRETGISVIGDVRWGTHFCSFYETKEDLLETLVPYFKAGLESKEFCVWVVSQALSAEEAKHALAQAVPDLERHLAKGALEIYSPDEWYLRDGRWDPQRVLRSWGEKLNQISTNGYAGLRASGDAGWIQNDDWIDFRDYEKRVNAMIADQRSIILCTYPLSTSSGDQVFDLAHIHQLAVARRKGSWEMIEIPELKDAKAEIKRLNEELEQKVEGRTKELAASNEALRSEIAERKLAEEAVKQAEDRVRLVIDTIPTMAWSLRPDGAVDFVNQRWIEYTGLSLEEALEDSKRIVHPEDLPRAVEKWHPNRAAGNPHEDEMRLRRADGEYRWFLIRIVPLRDEQGNIVTWYGTSTDIEDRKQAEMQSRALIDAIPHQIWSSPPDGATDYCNERWRSYSGLELEDVRGYGWQTMVHPDDRDRVLAAWHASVASGTPYEQEERHRGTDGRYRWFLSLGVPLRDPQGRIVRWYGTNTDIEDRKRAEEALRNSERLFAAFMDHMPGFAWMKDIEGRYVWVNKKEWELDAYHSGVIGKTDAELWPAGIASAYRANDQLVIATRNAVQTVEPSLASGEETSMMVCKFPIFDQDGSVVMVAGAGVDITDRIQAEEALRESETRFRQVAENISAVFWLCNPEETVIHYVSPAYEKIWGRSCESLYAAPMSWMDSVHPDDRERIAEDERLHSVDGRRDLTYRIVRPDGSLRWIRSRAFPVLDQTGKLIRVAGIAEDITSQKQAEEALRDSEEQMRLFMEATADYLWKWDMVTRNMARSVGFKRAFGYSAQELDSSVTWWEERLHPDDQGNVLSKFQDTIASGGNACSFEYRFRRKDGTFAVIHDRAYIIRDAKGKPLGALGAMSDISERKEAEEALHKANRQLRILSRQLFQIQEEERRHLARELHDEIGQTLTAAMINLKIIAPDVPAQVTGRLDDSIQLLDRLLRQVRQLSLDLRPPLLDELGLAPTLRWLVDQQAQRAGLRVTFTAKVDGLEIDPDAQTACFRVAQEAITNIIRHAGAKSVAVEVRREAERLWLIVRDDGKGFDPAAIQQKLTQHSTLGLVSMRERTLLVRGGLEIRSAPGQGAEIRAWFPLPNGEPSSSAEIS